MAEAEAKTKADASARTARDGGRRRGGPRDSRSRGKLRQTDVVAIDPDTAVMSGSREAILRAAGAACLAVDEVRGLALRRVFVGWGAKYASQHISRRFVELLRVTLRFRNNAPTRGWQLFNGAASSSSGGQHAGVRCNHMEENIWAENNARLFLPYPVHPIQLLKAFIITIQGRSYGSREHKA